MTYTVKQVAEISNVSVRTLQYYDEIGLLNPSFRGEQGYRYYEEAELFQLQQILFYRELGFSLNEIQRIISDPDFDKLTALESHRKVLMEKLGQTKLLIETIDKTILYLRGQKSMKTAKLEEIFHGFDAEKQELYENFLVESGVNQDLIKQTKNKTKNWTKDQWLECKREGDQVYTDLVDAIKNKLKPNSPEVQKIIQRHYQFTKIFWTPDKESYIGLSQLYRSHPDFVKFYADIHPELLDFLSAAMKIFAEKNLS